MTWDRLWQEWWLGLTVTVVGGVIAAGIVAGIAAIFSKTVRQKFWRPLFRALRWPLTLRLTTAKRLDGYATAAAEAAEAAARQIAELERRAVTAELRGNTRAEAAEQRAAQDMDATRSLAQQQMKELIENNRAAVERAESFGRQAGYAEAMREVEAQRALPIPLPVWRVKDAPHNDGVFVLQNVEPTAVAEDVRVEAPMGDFAFDSSVRWDGPYAGAAYFDGARVGTGKKLPVRLKVRFRDANGDWREGEAVLEPPPRRAVVL